MAGIGLECGISSFWPFCSFLSRNPASSLASFENGGDFTSVRIHTRGLSFTVTNLLYVTFDITATRVFCILVVTYRRSVRKRPVEAVAREYASFRGKMIILWDDNIAADIEYAKALFRALVPHRKWWSSQASVHAAGDKEFLDLAARSGCKQLFLGLESASQASVNEVSKGFNRVDEYAKAIERVHAHGIAVQAGIVFGFDNDTETVVDRTLEFLDATGVENATFNILTPFPGTPLYRRLRAEGRILTRDWTRYNGRSDVVYRPRHMSPEVLLSGYRHANRLFYSWGSIRRRLSRSPVQWYWTLPLNLAYAFALRRSERSAEIDAWKTVRDGAGS